MLQLEEMGDSIELVTYCYLRCLLDEDVGEQYIYHLSVAEAVKFSSVRIHRSIANWFCLATYLVISQQTGKGMSHQHYLIPFLHLLVIQRDFECFGFNWTNVSLMKNSEETYCCFLNTYNTEELK